MDRADIGHGELERLRTELRSEMSAREDKLNASIQKLIDQLHEFCIGQERLVMKLDNFSATHSEKLLNLESIVSRLEIQRIEDQAKWNLIQSTKPIWAWFGKITIMTIGFAFTFQGASEIFHFLKANFLNLWR